MTTDELVLIVDDDVVIRDLLSSYLQKSGYRTATAGDGAEMWQQLAQQDTALVVLDLMLPGEDGLSLCRQLHSRDNLPVIMLSARGELVDRIVGLEVGADDYLPKPFDPRELLARIRGVLRRRTPRLASTTTAEPGWFHFAQWRLQTAVAQLHSPQGLVIALGGSDYRVLRILLDHPYQVVSREQLSVEVYRKPYAVTDRSIDVCISRLRRHLEPGAIHPTLIRTIRHVGYMWVAEVRAEP